MKRFLLLGGLLVALLGIAPSDSFATGRKDYQTTKVYLNEGNQILPFAVACDSTTWTVVVTSDTIRRSVLFQGVTSNSVSVCLSTTTASGDACNDSRPGPEIIGTGSLTDYSEVAWRCKCRTGAACTIKGYALRDTEDQGDVGRR